MGLKIDIRNFYNDYLPATSSVLFSVPSGYRYLVKSLVLRSEDDTEKTVELKIRRGGKNALLSPVVLKGLHTWVMDEVLTMETGDALLGNSQTGAKITCKASGVQEDLS